MRGQFDRSADISRKIARNIKLPPPTYYSLNIFIIFYAVAPLPFFARTSRLSRIVHILLLLIHRGNVATSRFKGQAITLRVQLRYNIILRTDALSNPQCTLHG